MRRYGLVQPALTLATGLFEAVLQVEHMRMPELFCGFRRVDGYGPTQYPVACSPQAWAAGVVFMLIASMLGLSPDAADNQLTLNRPHLPAWLSWIELRGLRLRDSRLTVRASQGQDGAAVEICARLSQMIVAVNTGASGERSCRFLGRPRFDGVQGRLRRRPVAVR